MGGKLRKYLKSSVLIILLILTFSISIPAPGMERTHEYRPNEDPSIKNVIVMIPDGCSSSLQTLARWKKGEALTLDSLLVGAVKTWMANSIITGSAAAVTAFATGLKTRVGFLSVGPDGEYRPMATVLEGAKLKGRATGLVATSRICHATPAGYAAHVHDRGMYSRITEQMVYQNLDVAFGGGKQFLLPKSEGGKREDGENLLKVLRDKGYQFVETGEEMASITSGKVWGLFAQGPLEPDIDRRTFDSKQPSLSEMTEKAIQLLSRDRDGFFLMVEGSQVDWAGHSNDPIYMVTEFLEFDRAVRVALDFAREDGNTLVLVFPDHDCGAMSIGQDGAGVSYKDTKVEDLIGPLEGMKITSGALAHKIGSDHSFSNISSKIRKWWGIDITENDYREIKKLIDRGIYTGSAISDIVCKNHTVIGWTTHGHSGVDVPLWAYGPKRPVGLYDNTELAEITAEALGFSLASINEDLFVEAGEVYPDYRLDKKDPENPVLKIKDFELPVNKNLLITDEKTFELDGIVVHAPVTEKVYIPRDAVRLIEEMQ